MTRPGVSSRARLSAALLARSRRLSASALPIAQCGIAAGLAWFVANSLVGHPRPFFAPVAAVVTLGASLGTRLRRLVELVVGVTVGIAVGDLLVQHIGSGAWQIALVVILAMAVAVFADGATLLVAQAGSSAVLVATLLPPGGSGGLDRWFDTLTGGVIGVLVTAVLPIDPVGPVRRQARQLLDELAAVLDAVADAMRSGDAAAAGAALDRARSGQPLVDDLRGGLLAGREITRLSPLLRPRRRVLSRFEVLAERADYADRNARVLARRVYAALGDGDRLAPELADAVAELAAAVRLLTDQLGGAGDRERAREPILDVVRGLPAPAGPAELLTVGQIRSIALDLLQATGLSRAEALAGMRRS